LNYIARLDPSTLETEVIPIPEGMYAPLNSWYAWTPDAFAASKVRNRLYWKGGANRWFSGSQIYCFDIDTRSVSLFIDLDAEGADWKLYGCSLGVHPVTDEIYMSLYHEFGTPTYITRRYSPQGEVIRNYPMIMNYWFPSLPVFAVKEGDAAVRTPEAAARPTLAYIDGSLRIEGAVPGTPVSVYSVDGSLAATLTVPASGSASLLLRGSIASGLHIARCGDESLKIAVE
ncbi:MAG: DUF5074 domain-containing protein, partial [Muribaculaceae bacterium]|nr:DUF5074 domain-containing protein [Muribaculaceae bacterium]